MARYWMVFPGELILVIATGLPFGSASTTVKIAGLSFAGIHAKVHYGIAVGQPDHAADG